MIICRYTVTVKKKKPYEHSVLSVILYKNSLIGHTFVVCITTLFSNGVSSTRWLIWYENVRLWQNIMSYVKWIVRKPFTRHFTRRVETCPFSEISKKISRVVIYRIIDSIGAQYIIWSESYYLFSSNYCGIESDVSSIDIHEKVRQNYYSYSYIFYSCTILNITHCAYFLTVKINNLQFCIQYHCQLANDTSRWCASVGTTHNIAIYLWCLIFTKTFKWLKIT